MIITELIELFIAKVKEKYTLRIGYEYDIENDYYDIWHTDQKLQFEDDEFMSFIGQLIREIFFKEDIYNVGFGYSFDKANEYNVNAECVSVERSLCADFYKKKINLVFKAKTNEMTNREFICSEIKIESSRANTIKPISVSVNRYNENKIFSGYNSNGDFCRILSVV